MFLDKVIKPKAKPLGERSVDYILLYMVTAPVIEAFPYFIEELADEMEFAIRNSMHDRIAEVGSLVKMMESTVKALNDKGIKFEPEDGLGEYSDDSDRKRLHQFVRYVDDMWDAMLPLYYKILHERTNRKV